MHQPPDSMHDIMSIDQAISNLTFAFAHDHRVLLSVDKNVEFLHCYYMEQYFESNTANHECIFL